jgi:hypothetical protein
VARVEVTNDIIGLLIDLRWLPEVSENRVAIARAIRALLEDVEKESKINGLGREPWRELAPERRWGRRVADAHPRSKKVWAARSTQNVVLLNAVLLNVVLLNVVLLNVVLLIVVLLKSAAFERMAYVRFRRMQVRRMNEGHHAQIPGSRHHPWLILLCVRSCQ